MVAEQRHHSPAGPLRVALQTAKQVDRLSRVGSAIEDVARLHQHRAPSAPPVAVVDDLRRAQDGNEVVEGAVDVANGHHTLGGLNVARRRTGLCRLRANRPFAAGQQHQHQRECHTDGRSAST